MDPMGLVATKNVYFSLLTYAKQLLLVTLSHQPVGIGNSEVGQDGTGRRRTTDDAVRTDRREGWNSYVDEIPAEMRILKIANEFASSLSRFKILM